MFLYRYVNAAAAAAPHSAFCQDWEARFYYGFSVAPNQSKQRSSIRPDIEMMLDSM